MSSFWQKDLGDDFHAKFRVPAPSPSVLTGTGLTQVVHGQRWAGLQLSAQAHAPLPERALLSSCGAQARLACRPEGSCLQLRVPRTLPSPPSLESPVPSCLWDPSQGDRLGDITTPAPGGLSTCRAVWGAEPTSWPTQSRTHVRWGTGHCEGHQCGQGWTTCIVGPSAPGPRPLGL